jgi:NCS2 family nucleobase:cation symporter-2
MIVGCVTPPIIIAGAIGLSQADRVLLIQASLIMSAVSTLLQLFPIGGRFGSGLPVILGVSFAYLPSMQAIAASGGGVSAIAGAMIAGGVIAVIVGLFVKKIRLLFPPVITGTVVFTIGLSLYPTAINYMAGGTGNTYESVMSKGLPEAMVYGSWQNWLIAVLTLAAVMILNNKGRGVCRLASILLGMLFGYIAALCFGMVSFADVGDAAWFSLPRFLHFGISFDLPSCVALGLLFAINSIQAIGDFTATTVGGMDRDPTDSELQGGIIAYGAANILAALFGGLPTATYSQNVGIVTTNKVVNRTVFTLTGAFLLLAGVSPKFAAVLTTIPQCVLGGATITVFSTIAMTGMRLIASQDLTARNTTIVGLSAALGVGISQASASLSQFPDSFTMIFGKSPVVIATLMAVALNLILPKEDK